MECFAAAAQGRRRGLSATQFIGQFYGHILDIYPLVARATKYINASLAESRFNSSHLDPCIYCLQVWLSSGHAGIDHIDVTARYMDENFPSTKPNHGLVVHVEFADRRLIGCLAR